MDKQSMPTAPRYTGGRRDADRCLNGAWQFQPCVPDGRRDVDGVPLLPSPTAAWSEVPLIVPSPWNGNDWGGRTNPHDPAQRFWTDGVHYPSYPEEWTTAPMGWLRRTFTLSADDLAGRLALHFDAVAGEAQVWVNGHLLVTHFDSYLPFEADITAVAGVGENEVLVGVRSHRLFDRQSPRYAKMHRPYPVGSNTEGLCGIWQDVWLRVTPLVYVEDVFVQPLVSAGRLRMEVTVANVGAQDVCVAPEVALRRWDSGQIVGALSGAARTVPAGGGALFVLETDRTESLALWSPDSPVLYTAECVLTGGDVYRQRFGWREFTVQGDKLLLNGQPIHLTGDICHPFGPYMFREDWIRSWYGMIQAVGGNALRLHAQVYPSVFLDVADEMGLAVLDESALFGSSLSMDLEAEAAWGRFETHLDGMVRRDRNHPSVFGWSIGNELFALFLYDDAAARDADGFYARLIELAQRPRRLDPTRAFLTCDGDEDLRGTLPVWSRHFPHGVHPLPEGVNKPLVIGESGGTYYARPSQLTVFCGEDAYRSYAGRNRALGIDVYANIRHMEGRLAYFSPSELVWFGLEPLPYGYHDTGRLPNAQDGIFFPRPAEGVAGVYVERVPPFAGTLNPAWDETLPEYRPLAMFEAMHDALTHAPDGETRWAPYATPCPEMPAAEPRMVRLVGDEEGDNARILTAAGWTFTPAGEDVLIDAATASAEQAQEAWQHTAGRVLVLLAEERPDWLPVDVTLTERVATQLERASQEAGIASLAIADMYTAESDGERRICRHGMDLAAVPQAQVLLKAGEADWSQFNDRPERVKCGATFLHECLQKPAGVVLARVPSAAGERLLTTAVVADDAPHRHFWRRLSALYGWPLGEETPLRAREAAVHDLLLNGPMDSAE